MARIVEITDAHSTNEPKQKIILQLNGGSPWYKDIWINDENFTIYLDDMTGKITVERAK